LRISLAEDPLAGGTVHRDAARGELGKRMGLTYDGLRKTLKRAPTMRVAVLVAFVADVKPEVVLSGKWPANGARRAAAPGAAAN
jgi:lambda repressor-like predicted transcriptional regulator